MIPPWNSAAVLPPIRPGHAGSSADRSPYRVTMPAVIERFATTPERIAILRGLLAYRSALAGTPIMDGFQWLDGSFAEHKEVLEGKAPNDIDVVTFYRLPEGYDQGQLLASHPELFDHDAVKRTYHVDSYTEQIGGPFDRSEVRQVSYWYSMWSHRRNGIWKGFVQVDLSATDDAVATALLAQIETEGACS